MSRWSVGPRVPRQNASLPSEAVRNNQKLLFSITAAQAYDILDIRQDRLMLAGLVILSFDCAPNSLELVQLLYAFGRDLTTFPEGSNARPLGF